MIVIERKKVVTRLSRIMEGLKRELRSSQKRDFEHAVINGKIDGLNIAIAIVNYIEEEKNKVEVEIPETNKDGSCGECQLAAHMYEDYQKCIVGSAEHEVSIFDDLYPGKDCPRYEESQEKRNRKEV